MTNSWYGFVGPDEPLTQGDIIFGCPVMVWGDRLDVSGERLGLVHALKASRTCLRQDLIVMSQACDIANGKVSNLVLCTHSDIDEYREVFEQARLARGKKSPRDAWINYCNNVKKGFNWNLSLLDSCETVDFRMGTRIVQFDQIHTMPIAFLEGFSRSVGQPRPRLLSPYREHLSQAFARFFMRVGLPSDVKDTWSKPA